MPNLLAGHVSLVAGTWALETLVKHYFERLFGDEKAETSASGAKPLRKEELLYDEAFGIVKCFMEVSTLHTVEELQEFSNTRTPSSPWTHSVRVLVPMTCCDDAATLLIEALGGEEMTRRVVGGTKWWQVRGLKGVDAQWMVMKKDFQEAKRRQKEFDKFQQEKAKMNDEKGKENEPRESSETTDSSTEPVYEPKMDDLRCILYFHGGGYYFGSIDQERYLMQRFARKTNSRLFAINYRLSPQYPFPCAIQDALAAYLFLIRPPPDSLHRPVNPAHIVISGDSAGGGLTLALLQVLRDTGTPMPAGSVLISPWCDLTHSFPSVHLNTNTDIMPRYGLSLHKPSTLWPPPPDELTHKVRAGLRRRIKEFVKSYSDNEGPAHSDSDAEHSNRHPRSQSPRRQKGHDGFFRRHFHKLRLHSRDGEEGYRSEGSQTPSKLRKLKRRESIGAREAAVSASEEHVQLGASASATLPASTSSQHKVDDVSSQTVSVTAENGEVLRIHDQIQFYCTNDQLSHPLVSPVVSYLGGLPPMLVIASDGEVLRDEIIYMAHKAAHPEKYPVVESARKVYPKLVDIEQRHTPTQVHLQVYDETAHVLPVLFAFCTPAKFCFRAMAAFVKYVTGIPVTPLVNTQLSIDPKNATVASPVSSQSMFRRASMRMTGSLKRRSVSASMLLSGMQVNEPDATGTLGVSDKGELIRRTSAGSDRVPRAASGAPSSAPSSPRFEKPGPDGIRYAGNTIVYQGLEEDTVPFTDNMIRERVSITGVIRPLEPENELAGCIHSHERIGVIPELAVRRYLEGSAVWKKKFKHTIRTVDRHRIRNLSIARKETVRNMDQLQMHFLQDPSSEGQAHENSEHSRIHALGNIRSRLSTRSGRAPESNGIKEGIRKTAASWTWAWAIDGNEHPPPSSIVARRDTEEARRLSKIADQPPDVNDRYLSGNNLWTVLVNALSVEKAKQAEGVRVSTTRNSTGGNGTSSGTEPPTSSATGLKQDLEDPNKHTASHRLSRLLSVRVKRHSFVPQSGIVEE